MDKNITIEFQQQIPKSIDEILTIEHKKHINAFKTAEEYSVNGKDASYYDYVESKIRSIKYQDNLTKGEKKQKINDLLAEEIMSVLSNLPYYYVGDERGYWVYKYNNKLYKKVFLNLRSIIRKFYKLFDRKAGLALIKEIMEELKELNTIDPNEIDNKESAIYMNFTNGHMDFTDFKLVPGNCPFFEFIQTPHNYNPTAECPNFDKFLYKLSGGQGDEEARQFWIENIWETIGQLLTKDIRIQTAHIFADASDGKEKEGSNGKSTLMDIIIEVIGDANTHEQELQNMGRNQFSMAGLAHKTMIYFQDLNTKALLNTGTIKNAVTAKKRTHEEKFGAVDIQTVNTAKFVYAINDFVFIPFKELNGAFCRRFMIHLFKCRIPKAEQNPFWIEENIDENEIEGIIRYAVEALKRLYKRKRFRFTAEETKEIWRNEIDIVYKFYNECLNETNDVFYTANNIYDVFEVWCLYNRSENRITSKQFKQRICSVGHNMFNSRRDGFQDYYFNKLCLNLDNEEVWKIIQDQGKDNYEVKRAKGKLM